MRALLTHRMTNSRQAKVAPLSYFIFQQNLDAFALEQALTAYEAAKQNFEAFPKSVKRGILEWIASAKQLETRAKRVEETAQLAAKNERANQGRSNP